jgi:tRNA (uracil-5-)-methyltransferase TRM9
MDEHSRHRLEQMTADFYEHHAASFARSRQAPWDTWPDVLDIAGSRRDINSVLDVGCGNGRFATFLQSSDTPVRYVGIDTSPLLLAHARKSHPEHTFIDGQLHDLDQDQFDLVASFGVLHHIAGFSQRAEYMRELAARTGLGGALIVSFWQPASGTDFHRKTATPPDDIALEPNDYLLGWNGDHSQLRYCHHFTDDEVELMVTASGLALASELQGTGNDATNRYVVLERPS